MATNLHNFPNQLDEKETPAQFVISGLAASALLSAAFVLVAVLGASILPIIGQGATVAAAGSLTQISEAAALGGVILALPASFCFKLLFRVSEKNKTLNLGLIAALSVAMLLSATGMLLGGIALGAKILGTPIVPMIGCMLAGVVALALAATLLLLPTAAPILISKRKEQRDSFSSFNESFAEDDVDLSTYYTFPK